MRQSHPSQSARKVLPPLSLRASPLSARTSSRLGKLLKAEPFHPRTTEDIPRRIPFPEKKLGLLRHAKSGSERLSHNQTSKLRRNAATSTLKSLAHYETHLPYPLSDIRVPAVWPLPRHTDRKPSQRSQRSTVISRTVRPRQSPRGPSRTVQSKNDHVSPTSPKRLKVSAL